MIAFSHVWNDFIEISSYNFDAKYLWKYVRFFVSFFSYINHANRIAFPFRWYFVIEKRKRISIEYVWRDAMKSHTYEMNIEKKTGCLSIRQTNATKLCLQMCVVQLIYKQMANLLIEFFGYVHKIEEINFRNENQNAHIHIGTRHCLLSTYITTPELK